MCFLASVNEIHGDRWAFLLEGKFPIGTRFHGPQET